MNSIRRKNVLTIGAIVAAFFTLITVYVVLIFRDNQIQLADHNLKLLCRDAASVINARNEQAILLAETMAAYQENGGFGRREEVIRLTRQVLAENDFITGAYVGYEPDADGADRVSVGLSPAYDHKGRFLPYWYRRDGALHLKPLVDMETSLYYTGPKESRSLTITEPYLYEGTMLLEVTAPILIDGRFAGIAGVDLAAAYLSLNLQDYTEFYQTAQIYLISDRNNIIAADDPLLIGQKASDVRQLTGVLSQISSVQSGVLSPADQSSRIFAYAPVASSGWMLVLSVAKAEIFAQANVLTRNLAVILAAALLILLIVLFISGKFISRPLNEITRIITRMANSDFAFDETRETDAFKKRPDEIGEIFRATSQMRANISSLISQLQKNETQYRTLVTNVPGVVYRIGYGTERAVVFISDSIEALTGYPAADFIQRDRHNITQIIHPDDLENLRLAARQGIMPDKPFTAFFRLVCADGSVKWVQNRCQGIFSPENQLLHVDGVILDMTEQVNTQAALRDSEITMASVYGSIQDGFVLLKPDLTIYHTNQTMQELYGGDPHLPGKKCYQAFYQREMPCDNCAALRCMEQKAMLSQENLKQFQGQDHWFESSYYPIIDDLSGACRGAVCMIRDITGKKLLEKELARIDKLSLVGQMAASIAHEIRNPMTSVRGFLQLLGGKSECQPFQDYFTMMISELDRANEIITQFLSLASNKPVVFRLNSLNAAICKILPLIESDARMVNQQVKTILAPLPDLMMDEKEISQLLLNLCRNGMEAMGDNGILTISTLLSAGQVELRITDQGKGIPQAVMEKLGTPFQTTKEQGTGLGLAVCFSIAHRHQAKIEVESSSQGTTFTIKFPVSVSDQNR